MVACWSTAMDAISEARLSRPSLPLPPPSDCPLLSSREGPIRDALKEDGECPDDPGPASSAARRACSMSRRIVACYDGGASVRIDRKWQIAAALIF